MRLHLDEDGQTRLRGRHGSSRDYKYVRKNFKTSTCQINFLSPSFKEKEADSFFFSFFPSSYFHLGIRAISFSLKDWLLIGRGGGGGGGETESYDDKHDMSLIKKHNQEELVGNDVNKLETTSKINLIRSFLIN